MLTKAPGENASARAWQTQHKNRFVYRILHSLVRVASACCFLERRILHQAIAVCTPDSGAVPIFLRGGKVIYIC